MPKPIVFISHITEEKEFAEAVKMLIKKSYLGAVEMQKNLQKLKEIEELKDNWNENGATKFSGKLIEKVKNVLYMLKEQPEIFPTAEGSIQLEYEKKDGQYLEINVYENHTNIFSIDSNEQEKEFEVKEDEVEKIKKIVEDFHERQ